MFLFKSVHRLSSCSKLLFRVLLQLMAGVPYLSDNLHLLISYLYNNIFNCTMIIIIYYHIHKVVHILIIIGASTFGTLLLQCALSPNAVSERKHSRSPLFENGK